MTTANRPAAEKRAVDTAVREFAKALEDLKEIQERAKKIERAARDVEALRATSLAEAQYLVVG